MIINADRNCINLAKADHNKTVYKVFTIERLIEIFETNKLTLVRL